MAAFDKAFDLLIGHEGGYVNNPADPGGETKYGISKRAYPNEDIAGLTIERAKEIYKRDYWDKVRGDELHPAVAFAVFDAAVNAGVGRAAKWLQEAIGANPDGLIGPLTAHKAALGKPSDIVSEMLVLRNLHNAALPIFSNFGKGWSRRLFKVQIQALTEF